ncbi:hypothetical protein F5884DRAFT_754413 [Xylogone sp. PMI_703]|nr:hypothetical protein F5884DRAFT_754413 [Xylogone sp. PMI_703]
MREYFNLLNFISDPFQLISEVITTMDEAIANTPPSGDAVSGTRGQKRAADNANDDPVAAKKVCETVDLTGSETPQGEPNHGDFGQRRAFSVGPSQLRMVPGAVITRNQPPYGPPRHRLPDSPEYPFVPQQAAPGQGVSPSPGPRARATTEQLDPNRLPGSRTQPIDRGVFGPGQPILAHSGTYQGHPNTTGGNRLGPYITAAQPIPAIQARGAINYNQSEPVSTKIVTQVAASKCLVGETEAGDLKQEYIIEKSKLQRLLGTIHTEINTMEWSLRVNEVDMVGTKEKLAGLESYRAESLTRLDKLRNLQRICENHIKRAKKD